MSPSQSIHPELLDKLRCPHAIQTRKDPGVDAGKLMLYRDCWLVCEESGLKYPIVDGIPVMLIEEGMKWKEKRLEDLPIPPPAPQA